MQFAFGGRSFQVVRKAGRPAIRPPEGVLDEFKDGAGHVYVVKLVAWRELGVQLGRVWDAERRRWKMVTVRYRDGNRWNLDPANLVIVRAEANWGRFLDPKAARRAMTVR